MDARCFQSTKWMAVYWSFSLPDFSLRIMIPLSNFMAWKEKRLKIQQNNASMQFYLLSMYFTYSHTNTWLHFVFPKLSFVVLHKSCQTQRLCLHMSVWKVSVKELQWNPNHGVSVTAALTLQAHSLGSVAQLLSVEFSSTFIDLLHFIKSWCVEKLWSEIYLVAAAQVERFSGIQGLHTGGLVLGKLFISCYLWVLLFFFFSF